MINVPTSQSIDIGLIAWSIYTKILKMVLTNNGMEKYETEFTQSSLK